MRRVPDLSTYLVTDARLSGARGVIETVRAAVAGGATTVQLREKEATGREMLAALIAVAEAVDGRASVLVDDRVDVYLAARAAGADVHGVHLGQTDLPVASARAIVGPDAVIGLTAKTHAHIHAVHALPVGTVDYLGVGIIHPTQTKEDLPPPIGVEGFARLAAATAVPCVAIGGIRVEDAAPLRRAGAAGVAVVSAICAAPDARAAAAGFATAWRGAAPDAGAD